MSSSTKEALAAALKQMMTVKPMDKITIKDLVEICGVNRQTFYYHFDDVYDLLEWVFEEDANRVLPREVVYEHWREDVFIFMQYLQDNSSFTLNVYNSNSRIYMLRYLEEKMAACIRSFAVIVSEGMNIDRQDFEFVVTFYAKCAIGFISQWMDLGMKLPKEVTTERILRVMDESVEDAAAAVQLLAKQEKIDPSRVFVLGHSLGGNAVPAIARTLREQPVQARGYIMMAASPRPLEVLMREQYDFLYSLLPEITPEQQAEKDAVFAELDRLQNLDELTDDDAVLGAYAPYWKWLAAYDVLKAAEEIVEPCLLLQGEEDYQATMEDFGLWRDALGEKDNWRLISYPGLTHLFTPGLKAEGAGAYARAEHVDAGVVRDIADFIQNH